MKIGTLTKQQDGKYKGFIATLAISAKITMRPNEQQTANGPTHRVYAGAGEVGAAFEATAQGTGQVYHSLKLDDPTFAAPLYCAAFPAKDKPDDLDLVWSRRKMD